MGLINHDSYTTSYGIDVTDTYISIGTNNIEVFRDGTSYKLRYVATIWASQADRDNDKRSLQCLVRTTELNSTQLQEGVYDVAYADLKTVFTNTTDA